VAELKSPAIAKKRREAYLRFIWLHETGKAMIVIILMKQKNIELTPDPILTSSILCRG